MLVNVPEEEGVQTRSFKEHLFSFTEKNGGTSHADLGENQHLQWLGSLSPSCSFIHSQDKSLVFMTTTCIMTCVVSRYSTVFVVHSADAEGRLATVVT